MPPLLIYRCMIVDVFTYRSSCPLELEREWRVIPDTEPLSSTLFVDTQRSTHRFAIITHRRAKHQLIDSLVALYLEPVAQRLFSRVPDNSSDRHVVPPLPLVKLQLPHRRLHAYGGRREDDVRVRR
ncbi:unnamed protein product [Musa acuminata subsp. burmannicoides]